MEETGCLPNKVKKKLQTSSFLNQEQKQKQREPN